MLLNAKQLIPICVLIAGCDTAPQPAPAPDNGGVAAQVAALPEGQRAGVLLRAVRDAGEACQGVEESRLTATNTWMARCSSGRVYLVAFDKGGTARVTDPQRALEAAATREKAR